MERRQVLKTAGLLATGGITSLAGCSSSGNGDSGESATSESQATSSSSGSNTVMMVTEGSNYYFDPIGLFVESGETVTFEIQSGSHSATAYKEGTSSASVTRIPNGAETFNSEILSEQGATYEHTFETTGTYDYFCIPHKPMGMVGRIVVGEPGGPAEGRMPPDGDVPESQTIVDQGSVSYSSFSG
ncbi:plastocyanin/azurin family copper-binding protein (plasmid) [Halobacterium sp. NMX12-1]|jgi:plastocyanin|uniref:Plastocyanin/azurin family copper-binding protein n=1 Tax=Halobacterium sp. NMX12-1 TaxID=3166650 RepID=A0AAU8CIG2_9EURY